MIPPSEELYSSVIEIDNGEVVMPKKLTLIRHQGLLTIEDRVFSGTFTIAMVPATLNLAQNKKDDDVSFTAMPSGSSVEYVLSDLMSDNQLEIPPDIFIVCIPQVGFVDERSPQKTVKNADYFIRRRLLDEMVDTRITSGTCVIVTSDPIRISGESIDKQMQIVPIPFRKHEEQEVILTNRKID